MSSTMFCDRRQVHRLDQVGHHLDEDPTTLVPPRKVERVGIDEGAVLPHKLSVRGSGSTSSKESDVMCADSWKTVLSIESLDSQAGHNISKDVLSRLPHKVRSCSRVSPSTQGTMSHTVLPSVALILAAGSTLRFFFPVIARKKRCVHDRDEPLELLKRTVRVLEFVPLQSSLR